jgi:transcriptional regulator with XRE-family HTH domain
MFTPEMTRRKGNHLGSRVAQLRVQKGWSQERLARRTRLSLRTINRVERGDVEGHIGTIAKIAKALGVTVDELLNPPERAAV